MILIKYNEIMSNATVDPEMKSRIMSAVSAAIKEQPGGAVVTSLKDKQEARPEQSAKKKARKSVIPLISSLVAGIIVIAAGALFINSYLDRSKAASDTVQAHNSKVEAVNYEIDAVLGNDNSPQAAAETTANGEDAEFYTKDNNNYVTSGKKDLDLDNDNGTRYAALGEDRIFRIELALPFEIKGTGSGTVGDVSDGITYLMFLGEGGEKAILYIGPEGTDMIKATSTPSFNKPVGVEGTTPNGTAVTLYCLSFGNVTAPEKGVTPSSFNTAIFSKGGKTYMITFSDIRSTEEIYKVIDAV